MITNLRMELFQALVACVYEVINAGKQRGWLGCVVESVKCKNDLKRVTKLAEIAARCKYSLIDTLTDINTPTC